MCWAQWRILECFQELVALSIIHFSRSALASGPSRPVAAGSVLRTKQLDLFTLFCGWRKNNGTHGKTEGKRFFEILSYSSHSLQWTFCRCLLSTVFDQLALFLRQLLTCVFEDDSDEEKKLLLYDLISLSHVTFIPANVCTMILTYQANHVPFVNGLYI